MIPDPTIDYRCTECQATIEHSPRWGWLTTGPGADPGHDLPDHEEGHTPAPVL